MALIVLDTDVVSHHRAGRIPAGLARQMLSNDISIAFATAAELWKGPCCIEGGLPLLTLNRRDFADFAEHDGLVLLGA